MMVSNRNLLFQGPIFRFHVCFGGCTTFNEDEILKAMNPEGHESGQIITTNHPPGTVTLNGGEK